jgi:hypothetical protein
MEEHKIITVCSNDLKITAKVKDVDGDINGSRLIMQ